MNDDIRSLSILSVRESKTQARFRSVVKHGVREGAEAPVALPADLKRV